MTSDLPIVAWSDTAVAVLSGLGALVLYSDEGAGVEGWRCASAGAGEVLLPGGVDGFHMFSLGPFLKTALHLHRHFR